MVDNIIYRLESENFRLEFNPIIHENDLAFPVNTSLNINALLRILEQRNCSGGQNIGNRR